MKPTSYAASQRDAEPNILVMSNYGELLIDVRDEVIRAAVCVETDSGFSQTFDRLQRSVATYANRYQWRRLDLAWR